MKTWSKIWYVIFYVFASCGSDGFVTDIDTCFVNENAPVTDINSYRKESRISLEGSDNGSSTIAQKILPAKTTYYWGMQLRMVASNPSGGLVIKITLPGASDVIAFGKVPPEDIPNKIGWVSVKFNKVFPVTPEEPAWISPVGDYGSKATSKISISEISGKGKAVYSKEKMIWEERNVLQISHRMLRCKD